MKNQITEEIKPLIISKEKKNQEINSLRNKHIFTLSCIIYANIIIMRVMLESKTDLSFLNFFDWIFLSLLSLYYFKKPEKIHKIMGGILLSGISCGIFMFIVNGTIQIFSFALIIGPNFKNLGLTFVFDWSIIFYVLIICFIYILLRKIKDSGKNNSKNEFIRFYKLLVENPSILNLISILVSMAILVLFEELIFRYLLINSLVSYTHIDLVSIILITSSVFSIIHVFNYKSLNKEVIFHLILCFLLSLIFSISMINNGLFFSWLLHLIWNLLLFFDDLLIIRSYV